MNIVHLDRARGEPAYNPGDRTDRVYFVRSGRVKIARTIASRAESIVDIRTAGEVFGELANPTGKSVAGRLVDALGRLVAEHGLAEPDGGVPIGIDLRELSALADVGLLRVAHKTVTLVQPQAFPFARSRSSRARRGAHNRLGA